MYSKQLLPFKAVVSFVSFSVIVQAAPLVSIGDNVDIFFNGSSSVQWQSNVFYDEADEQDDIRFTVSPGFEVNVGRGQSNLDLRIITRYDIIRYDELSDLDNELFHIKAISSYRSSRWDVDGLVSLDENQSSGRDGNSNVKGQLTESETIRANLNGEYRLSPKFSVGSGVSYTDKQYLDRENLADRESFIIPVDIFYELTPKVDLSVGYKHTATEVGETLSKSSYDQERHFFNIGARGNLLPKLTGFFKVGYTSVDSRNGDSRGTMGLDANFTYAATPKLTTTLALNRSFGVGGEGQQTTNTSANLSANYSINSNYSASANFAYRLREYETSGLEDNVYSTGVRLSYVPNRYWSFSTGYNYFENNSNRLGQGYEAHMVDLSASLRY
jgi:hypothetical protein